LRCFLPQLLPGFCITFIIRGISQRHPRLRPSKINQFPAATLDPTVLSFCSAVFDPVLASRVLFQDAAVSQQSSQQLVAALIAHMNAMTQSAEASAAQLRKVRMLADLVPCLACVMLCCSGS
jgi:hypothetical protein